jgi:serine/threonine protein kinase
MLPSVDRFYNGRHYYQYKNFNIMPSIIAEAYKYIDCNEYKPKFTIQKILNDMKTGLKCTKYDFYPRNRCNDVITRKSFDTKDQGVLGSGTFGIVYKIDNIAYKTPAHADSGIFIEINLMKNLNHENILPLLDIGSDGYSMPLMTNTVHNIDIKELDWFYINVLHGLDYLHTRQIIHRDLTVNNILINLETKEIKISDFGTSIWYLRGKYMTLSVCNPLFRAPEVDYGIGYDMKMDIWSLGMVMLEVQHGRNEANKFWNNNYMWNYKNITKYGNVLDDIFIIDPDLRPSASELLIYSERKNKPYTDKPELSIKNDHVDFIEKYKGKFINYPIEENDKTLADEYYINKSNNKKNRYNKTEWIAVEK